MTIVYKIITIYIFIYVYRYVCMYIPAPRAMTFLTAPQSSTVATSSLHCRCWRTPAMQRSASPRTHPYTRWWLLRTKGGQSATDRVALMNTWSTYMPCHVWLDKKDLVLCDVCGNVGAHQHCHTAQIQLRLNRGGQQLQRHCIAVFPVDKLYSLDQRYSRRRGINN